MTVTTHSASTTRSLRRVAKCGLSGALTAVALVVLVVAASGCGSGTPTAATTSASTTAAPVTAAPVTTTPSGPAAQSQLLPELVLPVGSTSSGSKDGFEIWNVPASWGQQSNILADLRSQLPLSKPYNGLAWCNEHETNFKTHSLVWTWDDGQNAISVNVSGQTVTLNSSPDDPTWGGCASAAHSALANVDMPTGSQLEPALSKPGDEEWWVLINYPETVAWFRQRLPLYADFQGLQWCQDASESDYTEWQWGDSRDLFTVHIDNGDMVTFKRGPDTYGCVKN